MDGFISTAQAAQKLGVSRVTLFNKIKSGEIEATKVGRNYIIQEALLEAMINNKGLTTTKKSEIDQGVARVVSEYGETLKLLKDH